MTLRNVHLITGGHGRCSNLSVDSGGTLIIENATVSHMDFGSGFQLQPVDGSTVKIKDTNLSVCGHEWPYGGIQVHNADLSIENSTISDTTISFFGSHVGKITGSTLSRSFWTINLENAANILIENNRVTRGIDGLIRGHGSNFTVTGNEISGAWQDGINIWSGTGMIIDGNTIAVVNRNATGISIGETDACICNNSVSNARVGIITSQGQTIENNQIADCSIGIEVGWNNTSIRNNTISGCETGIDLTGEHHRVNENTLSGCSLGVKASDSGSLFYRNNFTGTEVAAQDNGQNFWDSGPITGGNYWSTHECTGNPSDGSHAYEIPANGRDNYPFQYPYGWELGDMDDNGVVNLNDALITLKVMAGCDENCPIRLEYADSHADVDGNSVVGHPETLYILQLLAGMR